MNILTKNKVAIFLIAILFAGMAVIVYQERPLRDVVKDYSALGELNADTKKGLAVAIGNYLSFTLDEVAQHATADDCWVAINSSVYDLSSWVSRHPGGPSPIINICGQEASELFNNQHGGSNVAQAALILLKIGSLQE